MRASLHSTWLETVHRDPSATALIDAGSGRTWTRAELNVAVEIWRATLPPARELRGQIVLFALPNGLEWLTAFLALQANGAIAAALDPQEPESAQRSIAAAIGAQWRIVRGAETLELSSTIEPRPPGRGIGDREVAAPSSTHTSAPPFAPHPSPSSVLPPLDPRPRPFSRSTCLLKLTSGSTGTPKALAFTAAQMLADGRQVCATMDIGERDRNLAVIPFGHSYGLGNLVIPLLVQGTAIVCAANPLPHSLAADCARWQPTVFPAVPALLRALAASDLAADALAHLRVIISAGAPLSAESAAAFAQKFHRRVHNFYGSSETGGICYDRSGEATLSGRSVGSPLDGVTLHLRNGKCFTIASAAVMGRGRHAAADRGELNADGELVLLGRNDRSVKIAGRRLDLGEVETALRAVTGVRDAWVMPHPQRPDALAAAVATDLSADAIRTALVGRLASWKIPARLIPLAEFPVTARGKIDTRALRTLLDAPRS